MKKFLPRSLPQTGRLLLTAALGLAALPAARAQQPPAAATPAMPVMPPRAQPPKIVLKLDDMVGPHANWQKVLDEVNKRQIKASFGIICASLEKPQARLPQSLSRKRARRAGASSSGAMATTTSNGWKTA